MKVKTEYIYAARNRDFYKDNDDYPTKGKLRLFYDIPMRENDKWGFAREICELPSYMYPEITWERGVVRFEANMDIK